MYFTLKFNLVSLPASLQTICLFCQFLSQSMTPPWSAIICAGRSFHLVLGFEFPDLSAHEFKIAIRGIEWLAHHHPHHAPLSPLAFLVPLCCVGLILTLRTSPFHLPFCLPLSCLHAFLTLFPSHPRHPIFRRINIFVVMCLVYLVQKLFSLVGVF